MLIIIYNLAGVVSIQRFLKYRPSIVIGIYQNGCGIF